MREAEKKDMCIKDRSIGKILGREYRNWGLAPVRKWDINGQYFNLF